MLVLCLLSCGQKPDSGEDAKVTSMGSYEVTAKLAEIRGEFPDDPLYDYAYLMKYEILQVHRGIIDSNVIYVGHYKPLKPRDGVADVRSGEIGGNLKTFRVGDIHRMALEVPIEDYFLGGIMNPYSEEYSGPVHWAVWTNLVIQ
ncbi:MAG TPA: hypothetical protein PLZ55_02450 [bacterium]|nr:hypothetical protein [bacterium]HPO07501.1 hypothetical protein [bacterium]HQO35822.1 hypothetical protein [bacterium]HQP99136.1 hypothetical protein [bacterium]